VQQTKLATNQVCSICYTFSRVAKREYSQSDSPEGSTDSTSPLTQRPSMYDQSDSPGRTNGGEVMMSMIALSHAETQTYHHTTTVLRPFFPDHPGEPVPEEYFWTLWCKERLTKADTVTIRLGATPSGLTSAHLHHPAIFLPAGCPSCHPTNSVKALKASSAFGLGRRR